MPQREHSTILLTFIKLPVVIKTFVLSIFEWPFFRGFTVTKVLGHDVIRQVHLGTKMSESML